MATRIKRKQVNSSNRFMATVVTSSQVGRGNPVYRFLLPIAVSLLLLCGGCSDDCVDCPDCLADPPAVPAGVFSVTGDHSVTIYWSDVYYPTIERLTEYNIYWRFYEPGDENDDIRVFEWLATVAWDHAGFDPDTGLHRYEDTDVENGEMYEYAVSAVNENGVESALSFELVHDTPLPMDNGNGVTLYDADGADGDRGGFDFSVAGVSADGDLGVVDPNPVDTTADIKIVYDGGIPYVVAVNDDVSIQDYGSVADSDGNLYFEVLGWAPPGGYSSSGRLELITGHAYAVRIDNEPDNESHYAKFAVKVWSSESVTILWAYQLVADWPELKSSARTRRGVELDLAPIKM